MLRDALLRCVRSATASLAGLTMTATAPEASQPAMVGACRCRYPLLVQVPEEEEGAGGLRSCLRRCELLLRGRAAVALERLAAGAALIRGTGGLAGVTCSLGCI